MRLVLVTRQGCHLCDEAHRLLRGLGHEPAVIDVDADQAAFALYDWRVPVVLLDDRVVAEGRLSAGSLKRALSGTDQDREGRPRRP